MRGHGGNGAHVYSVLAIIISDDELIKDPKFTGEQYVAK